MRASWLAAASTRESPALQFASVDLTAEAAAE